MALEPVCVTRDEIVTALDIRPSSYLFREVDRACRSATRSVEGLLHRYIVPEVATRYFNWPSPSYYVRRIDFDEHSLLSATSVVSDGVTMTADTDYFLEPINEYPPYDFIELNRDSSKNFAGGPQRAVAITGLWGLANDEQAIGALSGAASDSTITLTLTRPTSVGAILRVGTERLQVSDVAWVASGQTSPALSADRADISVAVSTGSSFTPGEYLLIGSERVQVDEISGNVLTVRRAAVGSVLAAHTLGTAIYWQHTFTVERGSLGTTAAAHNDADTVYRWVPPTLVTELAQAYAEDSFLQRNAGYARSSSSAAKTKPVYGRGIDDAEKRCRMRYGRGYRTRAV